MKTPIELTPELEKTICEAVVDCFSLKKAYRAKKIPICDATVWKLAAQHPEFAVKLNEARLIGVKRYIDEALDVAYNSEGDIFGESKDGRPRISYECVNRSKLKVDTIYRMMAIIDPQRYSEAFYKPKDRKVKLDKAKSGAVSDRVEVLYQALENGHITPEEAMKISNVLQVQVNVVDTQRIIEKLNTLEKANADFATILGKKN